MDQAKGVAGFFAWRVGLVLIGTVVALVGGFWFLLQSVTDTINKRIDDVRTTQTEIIRKVDKINDTVVKLDTMLSGVDWKKFAAFRDGRRENSVASRAQRALEAGNERIVGGGDEEPETQTVEAVDVDGLELVDVIPGSGVIIDLTGRDGSLRSCYANGGFVSQDEDLNYRCVPNPTLDPANREERLADGVEQPIINERAIITW